MNINKWIDNNCTSLDGKTIVLTGATGGLGSILANYLAKLNAKIILACRNQDKTKTLINKIKSMYQKVDISFLPLDLADMKSVNSAIGYLKTIKIDYLIHNSGVYNVKRYTTDIGMDNVFQINFFAPYYMTKELLPHMNNNGKIIVVGSIAHNYSKLDESDIEFQRHKKASEIYGNSKRFLMFSMYELLKNSPIKISIAHPGVTLTNMTNHYPKAINWLVKLGIKLIFPNPNVATLNLLQALYLDCEYHEWIGPKFKIWGKPTKKKLKTCTENESQKIYEIAEKLYNNYKEKINY